MTIHLTDEQRQAVQAGQPVEVVDAESRLPVIVVSATLFRGQLHALPPAEPPAQSVPAKPARPIPNVPCRLRDLPTPPDLLARIESYCKEKWFWRKKYRNWVEAQFKLQYFFGDVRVGYVVTADGGLVIAAAQDSEAFSQQFQAIPLEQRQQAVVFSPTPWDNEASQLWTPFSDET
jgi:hypothetical protein